MGRGDQGGVVAAAASVPRLDQRSRVLVGRRMNYAARAPQFDATSELAGYEVQYVLGEPLTGGGVDDA